MNWLQRLVAQYGDKNKIPAGSSKHNRAKTKPAKLKQSRKARRVRAARSRAVNRLIDKAYKTKRAKLSGARKRK